VNNLPFFSIITASLNNAGTLENTLKSVMNQNYLSFEHIVVDGNSSDHSVELLGDYQKRYKLSWISERDSGIGEAMNKGLSMAKGQYIMVLQADDRLLRDDTLETVFRLLRDESFDMHSFPVILDHPVKGPVLRAPIRCRSWNRYKFIFLHQGAFVHRRVFEKIGGFRERFSIAMDYDFFYRALSHDFSVKFESIPVALMGGEGVGSRASTMFKRLGEEKLVQRVNEENAFWRFTQSVFWLLYLPYKTHLLPRLRERRGGSAITRSGIRSGKYSSHERTVLSQFF
jgi:glycosyltransferase involved in cell wall biosynthesis